MSKHIKHNKIKNEKVERQDLTVFVIAEIGKMLQLSNIPGG